MKSTTDSATEARTPEDSVRRFLLALSDPGSLRDEREIERLRGELSTTVDPLERLALFSAIDRAENVDVQAIRAEFLRQAKTFAAVHDITANAFAAMGVSREDLLAAGLLAQAHGAAPAASKPARRRARRPGLADVIALVPEGPFTCRQLEELSGASAPTAKRAVSEMLSAGSLVDLGFDPDHRAPGRAPRRYSRA